MQPTYPSQPTLAPPSARGPSDLGALSHLDNAVLANHLVPHLLQGDLDTFEKFSSTCRRSRLLGLAFVRDQLTVAERKLTSFVHVAPADVATRQARKNVRKVRDALKHYYLRTAPNTLAILARSELKASRYAFAEQAANFALHLRPDCILAVMAKAEVCIYRPGREREAVQLLSFASSLQPNNVAPLLCFAGWKLKTNAPGEAMPPLYAALRAQPESVAVHRFLASGLQLLGQLAPASAHWQTALELDAAKRSGDDARAELERARQAGGDKLIKRLVGNFLDP